MAPQTNFSYNILTPPKCGANFNSGDFFVPLYFTIKPIIVTQTGGKPTFL